MIMPTLNLNMLKMMLPEAVMHTEFVRRDTGVSVDGTRRPMVVARAAALSGTLQEYMCALISRFNYHRQKQ